MTQKRYDKLVLKIANITQEVAQVTMDDVVADLRQQCQNNDEILDIDKPLTDNTIKTEIFHKKFFVFIILLLNVKSFFHCLYLKMGGDFLTSRVQLDEEQGIP